VFVHKIRISLGDTMKKRAGYTILIYSSIAVMFSSFKWVDRYVAISDLDEDGVYSSDFF